MTVTPQPAQRTTVFADPSLLAPGQVRRSAVSCIAQGTTPQDLRVRAVRAYPDLRPVWHAWADEIETLTGRGMTREQAARITARLQRLGGAL